MIVLAVGAAVAGRAATGAGALIVFAVAKPVAGGRAATGAALTAAGLGIGPRKSASAADGAGGGSGADSATGIIGVAMRSPTIDCSVRASMTPCATTSSASVSSAARKRATSSALSCFPADALSAAKSKPFLRGVGVEVVAAMCSSSRGRGKTARQNSHP